MRNHEDRLPRSLDMARTVRQVRVDGHRQLAHNSGAGFILRRAGCAPHESSPVERRQRRAYPGTRSLLWLLHAHSYFVLRVADSGLISEVVTARWQRQASRTIFRRWFLWTVGILLAAGVALLIRSVLGIAPFGVIESAMGLRPANSSDLEERQLAKIVGEMAIAGGVPEPRVFLTEGEVVNAGAAGNAPSTVFVSRRLLDHMDRDETQGVLGHLLDFDR
jgi:Zn-dependent protease with chaperone function